MLLIRPSAPALPATLQTNKYLYQGTGSPSYKDGIYINIHPLSRIFWEENASTFLPITISIIFGVVSFTVWNSLNLSAFVRNCWTVK